MGNPIKTKIQLRRDLLSAWENKDPILAEGEIALVATSGNTISATAAGTDSTQKWKIKIGDGVHHFTKLPDIAYADSGSDAKITYLSNTVKELAQTSATWNEITGVSSSYVLTSVNQALSTKVDNLSTYAGNLSTYAGDLSTRLGENEGKVNKLVQTSSNWDNAYTLANNLSTRLSDDEGKYVLTSDNDALSTEVTQLCVYNRGLSTEVATLVDNLSTHVGNNYVLTSDNQALSTKVDNLSTYAGNLSTRLGEDENNYVLTSVNQALSTKVNNLVNDSAVTLSAGGRTDDVFKYLLKQGNSEVGVIEVPYDVFVNKGELSTVGDKTYLMLTLNNSASTVISIAVDSLVNIYTGLSTETIDVVVDNYKISAEVSDGSITGGANGKIALSTITTNNLATNAVYTGNINDKAVTGGANGKIALSTITIDNLANNAVETRAIKDSAVTTAKIADKAVTGGTNGKIALSTITTANLAANAVYTGNINDGAVTPAKMYSDGVFVFDCGDANAPQPS